jgi:hypothetical protein
MSFKKIGGGDEDKDCGELAAENKGYDNIIRFGNISSKQDLLECT